MDRLPHHPGRRPRGREPVASFTVPGLVSARVLDADLASPLWLTLDGNVPLFVAGSPALAAGSPGAPRAFLETFLDLLPPTVTRLDLDGPRETLSWLGDVAPPPQRLAPPETTFLVAGELGRDEEAGMSGPATPNALHALLARRSRSTTGGDA